MSKYTKFIRAITVSFIGLSFVLSPVIANAQQVSIAAEQMPPVSIVSESQEQLLALGCEVQTVSQDTKYMTVSPDKPYPVVTEGTQSNEVFLCSKNVVNGLTVKGKVAFVVELLLLTGIVTLGSLLFSHAAGVAVGRQVTDGIAYAVGFVFESFARLFNYLIHLAGSGVTHLLNIGTFFTDPLVTKGWPIVLGLSNLGFVLGLLFIAITTILRISGFDARRLLVRLLIAALLINFSLVIGVLIIDMSRLVTAAIYTGLVGNSIDYLSVEVIAKSKIVTKVFEVDPTGGLTAKEKTASWGTTFDSLLAMVALGILMAGFVAVLIGLLIRYFVLIFLLIVSPVAYLFLALPGTGHLARKWWDQFIRYVVYGPVVVFILGLYVSLNDSALKSLSEKLGGNNFGAMAMVILTAMFMFGAAMAGKYVGAAAAGAAGGFIWGQTAGRAGRYGREAAGFLGREALYATGRGLRPLQKLPGVRSVVRDIRQEGARRRGLADYYKEYAEDQAKPGYKRGRYAKGEKPKFKLSTEDLEKYQEEEMVRQFTQDVTKQNFKLDPKLDPEENFEVWKNQRGLGQTTTGGQVAPQTPGGTAQPQAGQQPTPQPGATPPPLPSAPPPAPIPSAPTGPAPRPLVNAAREMRMRLNTGATTIQNALQQPALSAQNLQSTEVKNVLGTNLVSQILQSSPDAARIMAIVQDPQYISTLDGQTLAKLGRAIDDNQNLSLDEQLAAADALIDSRNQTV